MINNAIRLTVEIFEPETLPPLPPKWSAPAANAPAEGVWKRFEEVQIRCTTTICDADLHCFRLTKKLAAVLTAGSCRDCGRMLVSLGRTGERQLGDIDHTFAALQRECIRHFFWHVPFGEKAMKYALRAGWVELRDRVPRRIRSRIGDAEPYFDGRQTPVARNRADAIDFALHAVAACCRKCANYWHGIPIRCPLTTEEIDYLSELARRYLRTRLPSLPDTPRHVPREKSGENVYTLPVKTQGPHPSGAMEPHAS